MDEFCTAIEHLALAARDPERLAEWYVATLGFRIRLVLDDRPGPQKAYLLQAGAGTLLEIYPADECPGGTERSNTAPGLAHFALLVRDFNAAQSRLDQAGVRSEGAERAGPLCARVRFYRDPEGNLFHILFRPQPL